MIANEVMAYMRGDYYLWNDESGLHLWVADGYDGWDESGWHRVDDGDAYPIRPEHLKDGKATASGVSIPQQIMDEYVVMRLAELLKEGMLEEAVDRAISNTGRASLIEHAKHIKALSHFDPRD